MNDANESQERRQPGRRTRRGAEHGDDTLAAPTAHRIGHVHATITINPHDPSQRIPSPASRPGSERRITEVVDLTNDEEDRQERQFVNPILRHLFTIPLIMGTLFDQPLMRQSRTPDQRDHSSLMELYGGGYWNRRREEAKKKEEEAKNGKERPVPPKIRLTQRSPVPSNGNSNGAVYPIDLDASIAHPSNGNNEHVEPLQAAIIDPSVDPASAAATPEPTSQTGASESNGATRPYVRPRAIRQRRGTISRANSSIETTPATTPAQTATPAEDSSLLDIQTSATPTMDITQDDDEIQVVSVSPAPNGANRIAEAIDLSQEQTAVEKEANEEDKLTAATMKAPANSIFKDYKCVVCLDSVVDATATFCGHIFCEACILNAIDSNHRCPTCRCKLSAKEIHPLFV